MTASLDHARRAKIPFKTWVANVLAQKYTADQLRRTEWYQQGIAAEAEAKIPVTAVVTGPGHGISTASLVRPRNPECCAACEGDPEAHDLHVCGRVM